MAEGEGEVDLLVGEVIEQFLNEFGAFVVGEADFLGEVVEVGCFINVWEFFEGGFGEGDGFFFVFGDEGEEGFGEAGEIPLSDAGLVFVCVATLLVDVAVFLSRIEVVHEGTGAVVDCFSAQALSLIHI